MHNLNWFRTVLTAILRERSAEYAENAANSANAEMVFVSSGRVVAMAAINQNDAVDVVVAVENVADLSQMSS